MNKIIKAICLIALFGCLMAGDTETESVETVETDYVNLAYETAADIIKSTNLY